MCDPEEKLYNIFKWNPQSKGKQGRLQHFSNHILIQRLNKEVNVGDWASSESPGFRILFIWKSQLLQSSPLLDFCPGIQNDGGTKEWASCSQFQSQQQYMYDLCASDNLQLPSLHSLLGNRQTPEHSGKSWFQDLGTWT